MQDSVTSESNVETVGKCCGTITCGGSTGNPDVCGHEDCYHHQKHIEFKEKIKKEE